MKYLHFVVICVTHCIYNKSSAVPELKRRDRKSFHNLKRKGTFLPRRGSKVGGGGSEGGGRKSGAEMHASLSLCMCTIRANISAREKSRIRNKLSRDQSTPRVSLTYGNFVPVSYRFSILIMRVFKFEIDSSMLLYCSRNY